MRQLTATLLLTLGAGFAAGPTTVRFQEVETLFQNPGKGWMCGASAKNPRFPCSVVYIRFNWEDVEPEEGRYNWKVLDEPIAAAKARGATIAFRVMTANAHSRGYYCSPKWLFDAGCRSFDYLAGGDDAASGGVRVNRIEPDYSDPIYLARHGNFLRDLGRRYDGHAGVEVVDIGSYGIWGEWHTKHPVDWEVRRKIIDMYLSAFPHTPLVMMSDDAEAMAYTLPRGTGFRRDGVGSPWHEENWIGSKKYKDVPGFADAWKRGMPVFEWYMDYVYLLKRGWSFDRAVHFLLNNHVSLINDNIGKVPDEAMPQLRELARRSGYRFVLREVSYSDGVAGKPLAVQMRWSNVGVGRMYRQFPLELYLLDKGGNLAAKTRASVDPRSWLPGDYTISERIELPRGLQAGEYTLGAAMVDGDGRPAVLFAIDAPQQKRLYSLGRVTVGR